MGASVRNFDGHLPEGEWSAIGDAIQARHLAGTQSAIKSDHRPSREASAMEARLENAPFSGNALTGTD
jgi:hypothetical protein